MPGVNIYLPMDLYARVKRSGMPVSKVCQDALLAELAGERVPERELIADSPEQVAEAIKDAGHRLNMELKRIAALVREGWECRG